MMASLRLCTRPAGNQEETGRRNAESRPGVAHPADTCDAGFCQEIPSFQIQWLAHHIISTERENKKDFFYKKKAFASGRQAGTFRKRPEERDKHVLSKRAAAPAVAIAHVGFVELPL
jgi:hypothetical protein